MEKTTEVKKATTSISTSNIKNGKSKKQSVTTLQATELPYSLESGQ